MYSEPEVHPSSTTAEGNAARAIGRTEVGYTSSKPSTCNRIDTLFHAAERRNFRQFAVSIAQSYHWKLRVSLERPSDLTAATRPARPL